jgi:hypothetical protein
MKRFILFTFFAIAVSFCAMTSAAQAQATRTWVSGVGDDANPCSRTAPCKTFAGAISKTAAGGEIDALDPGGFGGLTITKALTIDGGGGQVASVLVSGTPGITVNAGANDSITLRNLRIQGIGTGTNGVNFIAGLNLNIENCYIMNFANYGIDFEPSVRAFMTIRDSVIEGNGNGGLLTQTTASTGGYNRVGIVDTLFKDNGNIALKAGINTRTQLTRVYMNANGTGGSATSYSLEANGMQSQIDVESSTITNSRQNAVHSTNSAVIQMSNSSVTGNNGIGLAFDASGQLLSFGQNHVAGNAPGQDGTFSGTLPLH